MLVFKFFIRKMFIAATAQDWLHRSSNIFPG